MIRVKDLFHALARKQVVGIMPKVMMSFTKAKSDSTSYFQLNHSTLDSSDLLSADADNPIQLWDTYKYADYSDRLTSVEYSRSIEYPYNVQTALADISLDNSDDMFSPISESELAPYNLPSRPVKLYMSYDGATDNVGQFVGITQGMPQLDGNSKTVKYHAMDFLSSIAEQNLTKVVNLRDCTTDVVLAKIVEQFGVLPSQYEFEKGANNIPFVFFDENANAGDAIRKLMQAEGGKFWLDEAGILRFTARTHMTGDAQYEFANHQILSIEPSGESGIVNHVHIVCDVRDVQEFQTIYTKDSSGNSTSTNLWVVPPMGSYTISVSLDDPCASIVTPTQGLNSGVSWFTTKRSNGVVVNTGVTATGELHESSYEITFTSTLNYSVEVDEMSLWGEPAKVVDQIVYDAYDDESVEKYGDQKLEITDNQFFQDYDQVRSFGIWTLSSYANYNPSITMSVRGDFSLQLGDVIKIGYGDYAGTYQIDSMSYRISNGQFSNTIVAHKHKPVTYFTLDKSRLNGSDLLA